MLKGMISMLTSKISKYKIQQLFILIDVLIFGTVILSGCKNNQIEVVDGTDIDELIIVISDVSNNKNKEKTTVVRDPSALAMILDFINELNNNKESKVIIGDDVDVDWKYHIDAYKDKKKIQSFSIMNDVVSVDGKEFEIPRKNTVKLDNLKKHLLKVSGLESFQVIEESY